MNATNMVGWAGAAPTVKEGGLAPNTGATRIFFELKEGDYAQLEICVRDDVRHLLKKISVYEVMDRDHNDLAVDLYVNGE
jgi:hypothetical protein